jgi:hypothetical protein
MREHAYNASRCNRLRPDIAKPGTNLAPGRAPLWRPSQKRRGGFFGGGGTLRRRPRRRVCRRDALSDGPVSTARPEPLLFPQPYRPCGPACAYIWICRLLALRPPVNLATAWRSDDCSIIVRSAAAPHDAWNQAACGALSPPSKPTSDMGERDGPGKRSFAVDAGNTVADYHRAGAVLASLAALRGGRAA